MQCPACQAEVTADSVYCPKCGQRLGDLMEERTSASPVDERLADPPPAERETAGPLAGMAYRGRRDEPERELWTGGFDPKAMIASWALCGFLTVVVIVALVMFSATGMAWTIGLVAVAVLWLYHLGLLAWRRLSVRYRLTTQRFFHEKGILNRTTNRIELLDIDDIVLHQGVFDRMVGVGRIEMSSSDRTDPMLKLPGIGNVKHVFQLIDSARREEQNRRSLRVDTV